jgi:hypothetical protein
MLKTYNSFLFEKLHINVLVDKYSDEIYDEISNSNLGKIEFENLPNGLNIHKLNIIMSNTIFKNNLNGSLDLNKSYKSKNGWIIFINLKKGGDISTLKHELSHAHRLTLIGKENMIKNLNHIKSQNIFLYTKNSKIDYFFYLMYLANEEEINSKVIETHGIVKKFMKENSLDKLNRYQFEYLIKSTEGYNISKILINFSCVGIFNDMSKNNINKLFYILEENKNELDKIEVSKFRNIKMYIKIFRDMFSNNTSFNYEDINIYKPRRGIKFYDKWIPEQGEKLKRNLLSLYDHYKK